jgi:hypothetical protein
MAEFRKKPVVIEAVYFDGSHYSADRVLQWTGPMAGSGFVKPPGEHLGYIEIPTMEGVMRASPGDWIIRGVKGELCPCKPDIFAATYEPAADRPPQPAPADLVGAVEAVMREHIEVSAPHPWVVGFPRYVIGIPEAAQAIAALVHAEITRLRAERDAARREGVEAMRQAVLAEAEFWELHFRNRARSEAPNHDVRDLTRAAAYEAFKLDIRTLKEPTDRTAEENKG